MPVFLFILLIVYFIFEDFNKIKIHKHSIRYRFVVFKIDHEKEEILSILFKNQKISTNQIFNIISSQELHPNHIYSNTINFPSISQFKKQHLQNL